MAILVEANYAKKLGLPGFSSHQYSVSIRTELTDLSQVRQECARLYRLLQDSVDGSIQEVGFMPDPSTYGAAPNGASPNGQNGTGGPKANGHHPNGRTAGPRNGAWKCSPKQRELIEKIVSERNLDKHEVEQLAIDRFGVGVRDLNKLQASGLIDELLQSGEPAGTNGTVPSARRSRATLAAAAADVRTVARPAKGGPP